MVAGLVASPAETTAAMEAAKSHRRPAAGPTTTTTETRVSGQTKRMPARDWIEAAVERVNRDPAATAARLEIIGRALDDMAGRIAGFTGELEPADAIEVSDWLARIERTVWIYREAESRLRAALDGLERIRPTIEAAERALLAADRSIE
jgi:hypothetical protein